jgi:hypothetical protein
MHTTNEPNRAARRSSSRRLRQNGLLVGERSAPTTAEIEAACLRINAKWSERRRRIRAGLPPENSLELKPISLFVLDGRC